MGLLSGLFGGSKTTVTQQSTNQTNLELTTNLENQILVDNQAVADAIRAVGELSNTGQVVLAAGIVHAAQEQALAEQANLKFVQDAWQQTSRYALWLLILAGAYLFWPKGKKTRK